MIIQSLNSVRCGMHTKPFSNTDCSATNSTCILFSMQESSRMLDQAQLCQAHRHFFHGREGFATCMRGACHSDFAGMFIVQAAGVHARSMGRTFTRSCLRKFPCSLPWSPTVPVLLLFPAAGDLAPTPEDPSSSPPLLTPAPLSLKLLSSMAAD